MAQKDIGNKVPLHTLKKVEDVEAYYDEWALNNKYDKDMKELAETELQDLIKKKNISEKKIKLYLLPKDEADKKNAIIEVRAGTGGLEASLFAADLFKMYEKVCSKKKVEIRNY